jgi:hypothetical protein
MYEETGSKRLTAQRLGVHENTVYATLRRRSGICLDCANAVDDGHVVCASCRVRRQLRKRARIDERLRYGRCHDCTAPRSPLSERYCEKHRLDYLDRNAAHRKRKATGSKAQLRAGVGHTPARAVRTPSQRERESVARERQILSLYLEIGSGREVARRLDVADETVYRVLRFHRGTCAICSKPTMAGRNECQSCLEVMRTRRAARNRERRRLGLCRDCGEQRAPQSRLYCETHSAAHSVVSPIGPKRGSSKQGLPSQPQRERSVLKACGQAGLFVWRMSGGCCELCGVSHQNKSVHIHHLDRDPSHNSVENLACLCFICHQLVHHLTEHANPRGVVSWIKKRYPSRL